jgi:dethiobiotin synthetase
MEKIFIAGIGTGVGKTVVSAVLCEALRADYWKPVQAGNLDDSDSMMVRRLVTVPMTVHPEAIRLHAAMSPHAAARREGIEIHTERLQRPPTSRPLVIEGAGGLMVPINDRELMTDVIRHLGAPVILVSSMYLGSINHTLLSLACIRQLELPFYGVIFNGESNPDTEKIISSYAPIIGHVGKIHPSPESIRQQAQLIGNHPFWKSRT